MAATVVQQASGNDNHNHSFNQIAEGSTLQLIVEKLDATSQSGSVTSVIPNAIKWTKIADIFPLANGVGWRQIWKSEGPLDVDPGDNKLHVTWYVGRGSPSFDYLLQELA